MKVLAGIQRPYKESTHDYVVDYIVELSAEEMAILLGGKPLREYSADLAPGQVVEIAAEWKRLSAIYRAQNQLEDAAIAIHAIATTLQSLVPRINESLAAGEKPEDSAPNSGAT